MLIYLSIRGRAGTHDPTSRAGEATRLSDFLASVEVVSVVLIVAAVAVVLLLVVVGAAGAALLAVASTAEKEGLLDD